MSNVVPIKAATPELTYPAWRFFRWWDEAMFTALMEATITGRRHVVRRSRLWPTFWLVTEVGA